MCSIFPFCRRLYSLEETKNLDEGDYHSSPMHEGMFEETDEALRRRIKKALRTRENKEGE